MTADGTQPVVAGPDRISLARMERHIEWTVRVALALVVTCLGFYAWWFWYRQSMVLAPAAAEWGQFGDFLGGVLNPSLSFLTFYWLTRSVRIQKEELEDAKLALKASAKSQSDQAQSARSSLETAALTAMINAKLAEVQVHRMEIQYLADGHSKGHVVAFDGRTLDAAQVRRRIGQLAQLIADSSKDCQRMQSMLEQFMNKPTIEPQG